MVMGNARWGPPGWQVGPRVRRAYRTYVGKQWTLHRARSYISVCALPSSRGTLPAFAHRRLRMIHSLSLTTILVWLESLCSSHTHAGSLPSSDTVSTRRAHGTSIATQLVIAHITGLYHQHSTAPAIALFAKVSRVALPRNSSP